MNTKMNTKMNTRRQTKLSILEVNIDFDDAITEWRKNKKLTGNGQYKYVCCVITNKCNKQSDNKQGDNKQCGKICYKDKDKCWSHRNK